MPRDILREYGHDIPHREVPKATCGGVCEAKEIPNYKEPVGPKTINDPKTPGIHGTVHHCGTQGRH